MEAPRLVRWGRSPYERGPALEEERRRIEGLGFRCRQLPGEAPVEELGRPEVLVVTSLRPVGARELDALPGLRLLVTTTSGYDHLDVAAARERGVRVARLPLARRDAVVEASLGMGLALLRDLPRQQLEARQGRWVRAELPERGIALLRGLDVGVVGLGVIGRRAAEVYAFLGARVWGWDPRVELPGVRRAPPAELAARCRLLALHPRLERGAPPVVDLAVLGRARPDLLLVNTARGGVLDLDAAWEALQTGRLGGLALDVFPREPYPELARLAAHPRVLVTPHAAGYHDGLARAIADELVATLGAWLRGEPLPAELQA